MRRFAFRITFAAQVLALLVAGLLALFAGGAVSPWWRAVALAVLGLAALATVSASVRLLVFRRNLLRFLRRMLAGNFDSGMPTRPDVRDEVGQLERLLNAFAEQLCAYDEARRRRVACSYRALQTVFRHVSDPLLLIDLERRKLTLNPAAQKLLGVGEDIYGFEALSALPSNRAFFDLVGAWSAGKSAPVGEGVFFGLPARTAGHANVGRVMPVKEPDDTVSSLLISLQS